eukprot:m.308088 g.308088  ORF g.308088 m.308088 type:complete len:54 (-) comp20768_c0_seq1:883-1044(-)
MSAQLFVKRRTTATKMDECTALAQEDCDDASDDSEDGSAEFEGWTSIASTCVA